jgi:hypothetical protein
MTVSVWTRHIGREEEAVRKQWTISTRGLTVVLLAIVAGVVLVPITVHAVTANPVQITDATIANTADVSPAGELLVTALDKNPLPVQGTVGSIPVPNQPQLLRHADVPSSAIVPVFTNVFHSGDQVAITSAIFANNSSANVNVDVFAFGVSTATSCGGAPPSPLGPDLILVSVPPHDSVVVPLPQPAIAPKRSFADNWCLGAAQFASPATADVQVTLEGYRL